SSALALVVLSGGCVAGSKSAEDTESSDDLEGEAAQAVTTCGDYNAYKNVYWGDLHLHTSYSLDAYSFGTRSDPTNAYLFAKGLASVSGGSASQSPGPTITQPRPLA